MQTFADKLKNYELLKEQSRAKKNKLEEKLLTHRSRQSHKYNLMMNGVRAHVPLEEQIRRWWGCLPESRKHAPFSTRELVAMLDGKWRNNPRADAVARALRNLGFVQRRSWAKASYGHRLWYMGRDDSGIM